MDRRMAVLDRGRAAIDTGVPRQMETWVGAATFILTANPKEISNYNLERQTIRGFATVAARKQEKTVTLRCESHLVSGESSFSKL